MNGPLLALGYTRLFNGTDIVIRGIAENPNFLGQRCLKFKIHCDHGPNGCIMAALGGFFQIGGHTKKTLIQ